MSILISFNISFSFQQLPIIKIFKAPMNKRNATPKTPPRNPNSTRKVQHPVSDNFQPKRLGLSISPPMIILQYFVQDTGRLYHHKMRLQNIMEKTLTVQSILEFIKEKHRPYFRDETLSDEQMIGLIKKVVGYYELEREDESMRSPVNKLDDCLEADWDFESQTHFDLV